METLAQAQEYLEDNRREGVECPCCDQFVKLYKRKLGAPQTRGLIQLLKFNREEKWVHITKIIRTCNVHGDFAKMELWGLIEQQPVTTNKKKNSGYWKITEKGKHFLFGLLRVPSHVFIYNGKKEGFSETTTDVHESLGKEFNYRELMNA